ncbi:hypothetical protein BX666DRAFT_929608 [Dichotomocladium elegans]|nr:hypothetical protein BX666DRAFT_929608 [Dichotomocladium elegans]
MFASAFTKPSVLQPYRTFVSAKQLKPTKFDSILAHVPPKPLSGWQIYLRENIQKYKDNNGKVNIINANKDLSAKWKTLSASEKERYNNIYKKEAAAHDAAYEKALAEATPQQIYNENQLRKKYKLKELKDPKAPKRPALGAYMYFLTHLRNTDTKFASLPLMEQSSEASKRFKALDDIKKKEYVDKANAAKSKYKLEKQAYDAQINKGIKQ